MTENQAILKRQSTRIRFKNADMDFMLSWWIGVSQILGMSGSQVLLAVDGMKDGDPDGWRRGFQGVARSLAREAGAFHEQGRPLAAGQAELGAAYALRAALQYTAPSAAEFRGMVAMMEAAFQRGVAAMGMPITPVEIPFEGGSLPGYFLEHDSAARPTVVMVGGGDTYREDLLYFAGYPGWKRGYNVLMVDLPGQGKTPDRGFTFRVATGKAISTLLNWLEQNARARSADVALYGVSGGGYFTAQCAADDPRVKAWVAASPMDDVAEVFRREFGAVLKAPGWLVGLLTRLAGNVNRSAQINLAKYAWQFGTADFKSAMDGVLEQAVSVDCRHVACPCLFLISEGEGAELKRQARAITEQLTRRGVRTTLREFTVAEGADGHCQLNNLRLAHLVVFDWLDSVFGWEPGDARMRC
jgi:pimeloyl-ACP methyl ester carboxylesterase